MNIAIIGGGNNGCVLATKFSQKNNVKLYISNRNNELKNYSNNMKVLNEDSNQITTAKIKLITDSLKETLKDAEYVFITYPQFLFKDLSKKLLPLLKNQHLVFVPGSGGAEFWFKGCLKNGCTLSGLQRVHAVTRIIKKGQLARETGIRKSLKIATIPNTKSNEIYKVISKLYNLPVEILPNYANITLINSNPILHTSRLYSLFKDYNNTVYKNIPLFYEDWDLKSANMLIAMDTELREILNVLQENKLDMSGIIPILQHYESTNALELKNKINSIQGFKGLETPNIKVDNGYIPDFNSRYFTADFPFGLDIILSFAKLLKTRCPNLEKVSNWYHKLSKTDIVFNLQDFNITSIEDILNFYK